MGQVHAPIFKRAGHKVIISGRETIPSLEEATKQADITIFSVPISALEDNLKNFGKYCKALMDFSSVKTLPIEWMLKYTSKDCEVAGLHPEYGSIPSIKNRSIIYCKTERTGEKCEEIVRCLQNEGAKIRTMTPKYHDLLATRNQLARLALMKTLGVYLAETIDVEDIYESSPPPTKIIIDLLARQVAPENDEMYDAMEKYNPFWQSEKQQLLKCMQRVLEGKENPDKIRKFFGKELEPAQKRAAEFIKQVK